MKSLYESLKEYSEGDDYPYHMPGHKRRYFGEMPKEIAEIDITEIPGFDNLHQPEGLLEELQNRAARLYGAEESFYLVNGSTSGVLSAVSVALPFGGHLLLARNCHKSAYHAAYLRQLSLSYLYPDLIPGTDISEAVTLEAVKKALDADPGIDAVLIVSPTYEGRIADVGAIAREVHSRGIPLIVDEAHGAHLGWPGACGCNSAQAGADLVIHSVHKTLPAMTQTALLHVNGTRIDRHRLRRFLQIYQTSSPSYVLMASIDNALTVMETCGETLQKNMADQFKQMLDTLGRECRHLRFLTVGGREYPTQDIGKLVICSGNSGLSGQQIYDILKERYHLQLEMAAGAYCLAMFTVGDGREAYRRMTEALLEMDGEIPPDVDGSMQSVFSAFCSEQTGAIPLAKAWDMPMEEICLQKAIGRIVGSFINLYPPGTPLLVPGEVLTEEKYQTITEYIKMQLQVQGIRQQGKEWLLKVLLWEK